MIVFRPSTLVKTTNIPLHSVALVKHYLTG